MWSLIDIQLVDDLVCRVQMASLTCLAFWQGWIKKLGIAETINRASTPSLSGYLDFLQVSSYSSLAGVVGRRDSKRQEMETVS